MEKISWSTSGWPSPSHTISELLRESNAGVNEKDTIETWSKNVIAKRLWMKRGDCHFILHLRKFIQDRNIIAIDTRDNIFSLAEKYLEHRLPLPISKITKKYKNITQWIVFGDRNENVNMCHFLILANQIEWTCRKILYKYNWSLRVLNIKALKYSYALLMKKLMKTILSKSRLFYLLTSEVQMFGFQTRGPCVFYFHNVLYFRKST